MPEINPERVSVSIENHIAHVRLVRGDKMNAVDQGMIDSVLAAADAVAASDARVCVLSGEGKAFCAGLDLGSLSSLASEDPIALIEPRTHGNGTTNQWQEFSLAWTRLEIPVIAALHGPVFGAGCQLALGADIRIAGPDLQMAVMEMKWGLIPDMGGMVLLPKLVSGDVLRYLTYTNRPVGDDQAERWGMVTQRAEDPLAAAMELAEELTLKSPSAIRAAKRLVDVALSGAGDAEVLMEESREQARLIGKPDQMEVIAAQFQKRPPKFG